MLIQQTLCEIINKVLFIFGDSKYLKLPELLLTTELFSVTLNECKKTLLC